jgi:hypothetical protein
MSKHSPTPWHISATGYIASPPTSKMPSHIKLTSPWREEAWEDDETAQANAAHIVKCVNAHDALAAERDALRAQLAFERDRADRNYEEAVLRGNERNAEITVLRDFAESPPIWWSVAADGALIHAELDGASVIAKFGDNSMRLVRADGEVLADLIVRARNETEKPQAAIEEIGSALLWSHRRSLRLAAIAAAKGGAL